MIPKITQDAPNIVQRYWCSTCGRSLPAPDQHDDQWRFCEVRGAYRIREGRTGPMAGAKLRKVRPPLDPTGAGPQAFLPGEL